MVKSFGQSPSILTLKAIWNNVDYCQYVEFLWIRYITVMCWSGVVSGSVLVRLVWRVSKWRLLVVLVLSKIEM